MKRVLYKLSFIPYFIVAFCCIAFFLTSFGLSWTIHDFSEELFSFLCSCSRVIEHPVTYLMLVSSILFQYSYKHKLGAENLESGITISSRRKSALKILFHLSLVPYVLWICFAVLMKISGSGDFLPILVGFFSPVFIICLFYQIVFLTHYVNKYSIKINIKVFSCVIGASILFILSCFGEV